MARLRVDWHPVTSRIKDLVTATVSSSSSSLKSVVAWLVSFSLLATPVLAAPASSLGVVVYADRAHVGAGLASVGATIFSGDRLSTEQSGSLQMRTNAARLLLASGSIATLAQDETTPAATLTLGSATFSTVGANALAVHVGTAVIRPNSNQPTIGQVTVLTPKELIVKSNRGSLTIAVDDDVREIPEGGAYRVVLDPNAADPQGPRGAGSKGYGGPPIRAAKSKFIWYAIAVTAVVTYFAVSEALESPDRP